MDTLVTPDDMPTTSTGGVRLVPVPSPTSLLEFAPQHQREPSVFKAQAPLCPSVIAATSALRSVTSAAVARVFTVPSPSCPLSLVPQHHADPSVSSAQAWS